MEESNLLDKISICNMEIGCNMENGSGQLNLVKIMAIKEKAIYS